MTTSTTAVGTPASSRSGAPVPPTPRGPLSAALLEYLLQPGSMPPPADDPLWGDDAQLALYCYYELHYQTRAAGVGAVALARRALAVRLHAGGGDHGASAGVRRTPFGIQLKEASARSSWTNTAEAARLPCTPRCSPPALDGVGLDSSYGASLDFLPGTTLATWPCSRPRRWSR